MEPAPPQTLSHYPAIPPPFRIRLSQLAPHPCVYLPGRVASMRGILLEPGVSPEVFGAFLDTGFRRSGNILYQPVCPGCRECTSLRIDATAFTPTPDQRRVLRRNTDLSIEVNAPEATDEKYQLYLRYLAGQHASEDIPDFADFKSFLYDSPVTTVEMSYRDPTGRLLAAGILDATHDGLSSVYFYWEPSESRRSLGIFSALQEIKLTCSLSRRWYHLGYWVRDSPTMAYKATFADHELLCTDGSWAPSPRKTRAAT